LRGELHAATSLFVRGPRYIRRDLFPDHIYSQDEQTPENPGAYRSQHPKGVGCRGSDVPSVKLLPILANKLVKVFATFED
jgi:hypothetical protein